MDNKMKNKNINITVNNRFSRSYKTMNIKWEEHLSKRNLKRNRWLVEEWFKLYVQNPEEFSTKKLTTNELHEGSWLKKYGIKEPSFDE